MLTTMAEENWTSFPGSAKMAVFIVAVFVVHKVRNAAVLTCQRQHDCFW
jgi:hypothetical protein